MQSSITTLVMGILNLTPDSFADGGKYFAFEDALLRSEKMLEEGVDIIDIGGESTRPGAERISEEEELRRVLPVIREVISLGAVVSVDTTRAQVAERAIDFGARYINDVSGGLADPLMSKVVASSDTYYIAMHSRGSAKNMMERAIYQNVIEEVKSELAIRVDSLLSDGIKEEKLIIDPGIGFSKLPADNWELLRGLEHLAQLHFPILIGASRKRFLGEDLTPDEREDASIAVSAFCATQGVWAVRTHSVKPHKEAIRKVEKVRGAIHG